ncbi:hypothetical protein [Novosphingobium sp.]|uniref:hypothetical protein n=1 Tax=Novosphingobium sp. TaxID=1874826 RepID=UPI0038BDCF0B
MAKRAAILPSWVQTLDAMVEHGTQIRVYCTRCKECRDVDLVGLRERVGGGYSLINRQCKCRLTPGCAGWNRFTYLHGVFRNLRDERSDVRFMRSY